MDIYNKLLEKFEEYIHFCYIDDKKALLNKILTKYKYEIEDVKSGKHNNLEYSYDLKKFKEIHNLYAISYYDDEAYLEINIYPTYSNNDNKRIPKGYGIKLQLVNKLNEECYPLLKIEDDNIIYIDDCEIHSKKEFDDIKHILLNQYEDVIDLFLNYTASFDDTVKLDNKSNMLFSADDIGINGKRYFISIYRQLNDKTTIHLTIGYLHRKFSNDNMTIDYIKLFTFVRKGKYL